MTNVLVTGATGFIGTNLIYKLVDSNYNISIFTRKKVNIKHIKNIIPKLDVYNVDLSNPKIINEKIKKIKPDIVDHLATYGVNRNQTEDDKIINTNILGTINLFNAILQYGEVKKIVNVGSCFEYGPKLEKIKETDESNPQSVYGISKVEQTNIAKYFYEQKSLPIITLRVFNTFGPFEKPNRLIPSTILASLNQKKICINNPNDVRDFVFVKDVVEGLVKASKIKKSGEILNIGTSNEYQVKEIVKKISKITKYDNVVFQKSKNHEYGGKIIADVTKLKRVLKWEPKYTMDEGLKETVDWIKMRK